MFDAIATLIDTTAKPLTADDDRSMAQRQAEALADACGTCSTTARRPRSPTPVGAGRT